MLIQPKNDKAFPESADPNLAISKSLLDLEFAMSISSTLGADELPDEYAAEDKRDFVMSQKDARAGCPEDVAACGEEDNGAGLESLVTRDDHAPNFY